MKTPRFNILFPPWSCRLLSCCVAYKVWIFNKQEFGSVRVALKDGEPFFCAMDICRILEIANGNSSIWKIFPKGVVRIKTPTNGGMQELTYLTEAQLYKLIMRSHAKNAEPLQDWVCGEVLPSIRRTGNFMMLAPKKKSELYRALAEAEEKIEKLAEQAKEDAPKVECYNALMDSNDCLDFGHFAKNIGLGRNKMFGRLRDMGVLMGDNIPYAEYMNRGYFRVVEGTYSNGGYSKIYQKTLITPKGQVYLQKRLREVEP